LVARVPKAAAFFLFIDQQDMLVSKGLSID